MMKMRALICCIAVASLFLAGGVISTPSIVSYQGWLHDDLGGPLDTTVSMTFSVYDDSTGGTNIWSETHASVAVSDGSFGVMLGSSVPLQAGHFEGDNRWLEIVVGGETIEPRTRLASVPWALQDGDIVWEVVDSIAQTKTYVGIARGGASNVFYGDSVFTHVNLGVACTTGTSGEGHRYATVGGGLGNKAGGHLSTIAGGYYNTADGDRGFIGGGVANNAPGYHSTVGGGTYNTAADDNTVVAGGRENHATGNSSAVAGGFTNGASGDYSFVGGGLADTASGDYSSVGGGYSSRAVGSYSTCGGGYNCAAAGQYSTVGGGIVNYASGDGCSVGGGDNNEADGSYSVIAGGQNNEVVNDGGTVGGGRANTAGGLYATVPGGRLNLASGDYSFAAGRRARALHDGTFVWADGTDADFTSTASDQFLIEANGGVGINTNSPSAELHVEGDICYTGAIGACSDGRYKKDVEGINAALKTIMQLRGVTYRWRTEQFPDRKFDGETHLGVIAQEVQDILPSVVMVDSDGYLSVDYGRLTPVLVEAMKDQQATIRELEDRLLHLEARLEQLADR